MYACILCKHVYYVCLQYLYIVHVHVVTIACIYKKVFNFFSSPTLSSHYAAPPTLMPMKSSGVHLFSTDLPSHRSHSLSTSHQLRPLSILRDPSITLTTPPTLPRPSTVTRPFQSPVSSGTIHSFVPVPVHQSRDRFGSNPEELSFDSSKTTPIISPINMIDFFENNKWLEDL